MNKEKSDSLPRRRSVSEDMTLVVSQEGELITVRQDGGRAGGRRMVLKPGAGPQERSTSQGSATVEARWEGSTLVVHRVQDRQTQRGNVKIIQEQHWELSEGGKTLTQRVKMKTPRRDLEYTLVFDKH